MDATGPQTPFYLKNITCPCCKKAQKVFFLPDVTSRLYFSKEKEDDQHVTQWEWKNPAFSHYNPYYYDILICPECSFCDLREEFISPEVNPSNRTHSLRDVFLKEKSKKESLISIFASKIDPEKMDFKMAVYLHLLAIYIQYLLPGPEVQDNPSLNRDWLKIGKLYLRLSWIFREESGKSPQSKSVQGFLSEGAAGADQLLRTISSGKMVLDNIFDTIMKQKQLDLEQKIFNEDVYRKYHSCFEYLNNNTGNMMLVVKSLKELIVSHFSSQGGEVLKNDLSTLANEVMDYSVLWPEVPNDENTSLKKSMEYYSLAAENDSSMSAVAGLQLLEFCMKVLKVSGRKDELDEMIKLFGRRSSNVRSMLMKKKSANPDNGQIDLDLKKISTLMSDVSFLYK